MLKSVITDKIAGEYMEKIRATPYQYTLICPECSKTFQVKYRNDRTYCYCGLPQRLVYVPYFDEAKDKARLRAFLERENALRN